MLLHERSEFQILGRYAFLGGINGTIHQVDLLSREPNKILKLSSASAMPNIHTTARVDNSRNCEIVRVLDTCNNGKDELTVFTASKIKR